jgi:glycosyltransferase involved in cell wall biosynthesis
MLNVLYLHRTRGQGVEGVHIRGIIDSFKTLGNSVIIVSPGDDNKNNNENKNPGVKQENRKLNKIFRIISEKTPEIIFELIEIAYNVIAARKIKAVKKLYDFELIYERYAFFGIMGAIYANKWHIPLILEINYTTKNDLVRKRSVILKPFSRAAERWVLRQAAGLVVVSSFIKEQLVNEYDIPSEKIKITPNAADPELFRMNISPIKTVSGVNIEEKKVCGFVGGFYPWHGVDLLINAFSDISDKAENAVLLLIGDGPERGNIKEKVKELKLENKVIFTGEIPHKELPKYVAAFSVGIMPDSNNYGSPMKIFEYMALGKPVVAPDYGPILDVIISGTQGLVFEKNDRHSLSKVLLKIFTDEQLLITMGHEARKCIEKERNWLNNTKMSLELVSIKKKGI